MEQKFVSFEDAIEKLGVTAERLHELRAAGTLRAYRDGKSWKFRTDEIDGMAAGGVPDVPPPSDIGLVSPADLVEAAPIESVDEDDLGLSLVAEEDLDTAPRQIAPGQVAAASDGPAAEKSDPDLELNLDDTDAVPGGSALDLGGLDDTVTAGASDIELDLELPESGPSDSILLSEETLGVSVSGSPSTIIGKDKLDADDADLELAAEEELELVPEAEGIHDESDVKLSPAAADAADVLSSKVAGSGVLNDLEESTGSSAFKDLEELEIDLAAESSPALASSESGASAKSKTSQPAKAADSDFTLDDLQLSDAGSNLGSTDVPILEVESSAAGSGAGSGSEIELAGDDDLILSDASGSDLTLDSGDSGINLISPADSGLALDDIPLEMGGSAILSSLSLEGSDPEISLIGGDSAVGSGAELQTDDDFQLTPLSEAAEDEGDSSSQVIALESGLEDFSDGAAVLDDDDFAEEDDGVILSEDFAEAPAGDLDGGYAPATPTAGTPYSVLNIVGLGSSTLLLLLAGMMMLDMMRNIWSWNETYSLNSTLMDAILGLF